MLYTGKGAGFDYLCQPSGMVYYLIHPLQVQKYMTYEQ